MLSRQRWWSTRRSTRGSIFSIRRTFMGAVRARNIWGRRSKHGAAKRSSPPSISVKMEGQGQGASPDYIRIAVEASLRRLRVDCIDLYQQHNPDPNVPIEDTLGALDDLVKAGKIREIGSSNFSAEQIAEADAVAKHKGTVRFMSVQNHYSLLHREPEPDVFPECEQLGLAFLPYFPLASGVLTGKISRGHVAPAGSRLADAGTQTRFAGEHNLEVVDQLIDYAEAQGHTILELAFALAAGASSRRVGDRRRDQSRANPCQCCGGGMEAHAGRYGGD